MKKQSLLSISVSLMILFAVANARPVAAQDPVSNADFLNNWTMEFNKKLPMRIMEVDFSKAFSYCPVGCQGKSSDYHIRIRGRTFGYAFNNPSWKEMAKMVKPNLLNEYCSSGAHLRNIELLSATYDSTEKHVFYYRIKPNECPAGGPQSSGSNTVEDEFWGLVKDSKKAEDFESYISNYPNGKYVPVARLRMNQLSRGPNVKFNNSSTDFLGFRAPTPNLGNMAFMRSWAIHMKDQVPLNFGDAEIYDAAAPTSVEDYFYVRVWTPRLNPPIDTRAQARLLKTKLVSEYCKSNAAKRRIVVVLTVRDKDKRRGFGSNLSPSDCASLNRSSNTPNTTGSSTQSTQTDAQYLNAWATDVRIDLPEMLGIYQLTTAWSRCPEGCQEKDTPKYLLMKFNAYNDIQRNAPIAQLERSLKPILLVEYCKTEAIRRGISLGVFFDNRGPNRKVNFWVEPTDCSPN